MNLNLRENQKIILISLPNQSLKSIIMAWRKEIVVGPLCSFKFANELYGRPNNISTDSSQRTARKGSLIWFIKCPYSVFSHFILVIALFITLFLFYLLYPGHKWKIYQSRYKDKTTQIWNWWYSRFLFSSVPFSTPIFFQMFHSRILSRKFSLFPQHIYI